MKTITAKLIDGELYAVAFTDDGKVVRPRKCDVTEIRELAAYLIAAANELEYGHKSHDPEVAVEAA